MRGNSYKFVATWETEVGHGEEFLSRRGVQTQEEVAQNGGGISVFGDFHSLASQTHS